MQYIICLKENGGGHGVVYIMHMHVLGGHGIINGKPNGPLCLF